jgi:hypothetical protein
MREESEGHHRHDRGEGCGHGPHGPHQHHCGHGERCGCHGGEGRRQGHFRRRFRTREERLAGLQEYLKQLQAEAQAVEERIARLQAAG